MTYLSLPTLTLSRGFGGGTLWWGPETSMLVVAYPQVFVPVPPQYSVVVVLFCVFDGF